MHAPSQTKNTFAEPLLAIDMMRAATAAFAAAGGLTDEAAACHRGAAETKSHILLATPGRGAAVTFRDSRHIETLSDEFALFLCQNPETLARLGWYVSQVGEPRPWGRGRVCRDLRFEPGIGVVTRDEDLLVLYHVTPARNVPSILAEGIRPGLSRHGYRYPAPRVYLTASATEALRIARMFAEGDARRGQAEAGYAVVAVERVALPAGTILYDDPESAHGVFCYDAVPAVACSPAEPLADPAGPHAPAPR